VKSALATEEVFDDLVLDTKNLAFTPDMILHFKRNLRNLAINKQSHENNKNRQARRKETSG
jgi:hypothetical protein